MAWPSPSEFAPPSKAEIARARKLKRDAEWQEEIRRLRTERGTHIVKRKAGYARPKGGEADWVYVGLRRSRRNVVQWFARLPWVDKSEIKRIYRECAEVSARTGVKHHVDHIVPLLHPDVCGLDVPWNLQILPADENHEKSNWFDPDGGDNLAVPIG